MKMKKGKINSNKLGYSGTKEANIYVKETSFSYGQFPQHWN